MPEPSLIVAFPQKNLAALKGMFSSSETVSYLYLGADFFARRYLHQELGGNFQEIDLAHLLDEVADSLRGDHVRWIDALNKKYGQKLEWWFGSISSRNVYASHLFQYSCYLEVLNRLWQSPDSRPALVFVESAALGRVIQKWGDRQGSAVRPVPAGGQHWEPLRNYLFSLAKWGYFALILLLRHLAARRSRKRAIPRNLAEEPQAVVHTFVHDDCLNSRGDFQDRYFPHLHEFLADHGFRVLVHPVLYGFNLNYGSIYARMRRSPANFIIPEDYLAVADYLFALLYPLRQLREKIEAPNFQGFDLDELLCEEKRRNLADNSAMSACLTYRLFRRLGKTRGLNPQIIIKWYENQVTDKALIAGVREAFPEAKVIGVQQFNHVSNYLNLYPCQSEVEAGLVPQLLLEMSQPQCQVVQAFTKDILCRPAAALRYEHLFQDPEGAADFLPDSRMVLVLLPFDLAESVEMLETLKAGLADLDREVAISVKCHPDYEARELLAAFGKNHWPGRFQIFQGPLSAGLRAASVVVSANSSAIVDAVVSGKPVLFLCRQTTVNQRVLADLDIPLITECFDARELSQAVKQNLALSEAEIRFNQQTGKKLRDTLFNSIKAETMRPFLGIVD